MIVDALAVESQVMEHAAAMVDFLETLVNTDSPSTNPLLSTRVSGLIEQRAQGFGFNTCREQSDSYGDNVVVRLATSSTADRPRVLMIGHMDTVFGDSTAEERPFRIEGDRAFGPGVYDMKAGLVIGLYAMKVAASASGEWKLPITFIFNNDEEPGSPQSRDIIYREARAHDVALILEPAQEGRALTMGRKGVGIFKLTSRGRAAHAGADPENGVNSIVDLSRRIVDVSALADADAGTTVNVGTVHGGTQPYVVPETTECRVDVRVATRTEAERIERSLKEISNSPYVVDATCGLEGHFHREPFSPSAESLELAGRIQAHANAIGFALGLAECGGASDGNLTAACGLPTVDGLGAHGGFAHSPLEFVEISSIFKKTAALASLLLELNASVTGRGI